jgi:hypothetical protein
MLCEVQGHPNNAYIKFKVPGRTGVITVEAKAQQMLDYEQDSIELVTATAKLSELSL